jgi:CRP-like cAMP-binding protein
MKTKERIKGDLSDNLPPDLFDAFAIIQLILFALTSDQLARRSAINFNQLSPERQIPKLIVQCVSIIIFGFFGLLGFIVLYDQKFSNLLAATSGMGIGLALLFKDRLADIVGSVQLQTDGLVNGGDYVQLTEDGKVECYQVIAMEQRSMTLRSVSDNHERKISNNKFLSLNFVNLSKQGEGRGARRSISIQLDSDNNADKVLEIFNLALEKLSTNNPDFHRWYACGATKLEEGYVTYKLSYECKPELPADESDNQVLLVALRFLKAASFKLSSSSVVLPIDQEVSSNTNRLLNMYDLGILKVLTRNEVIKIAENTKTIYARAGNHLIKKNENADSMYLISEGALEVSVLNKEGNPIIVATLWPGDCVGEMSLLTGAPRSADVYAKRNSVLVEINKAQISPVLESNPELIHHMSNLLAERVAQNEKSLSGEDKNKKIDEASKNIAGKILSFFFKKAA